MIAANIGQAMDCIDWRNLLLLGGLVSFGVLDDDGDDDVDVVDDVTPACSQVGRIGEVEVVPWLDADGSWLGSSGFDDSSILSILVNNYGLRSSLMG